MSDKKDKKEKKAGDSAKTKGKKLKRVEIIFSAALDEDFAEGFKQNKIGAHFTKLSGVTGITFASAVNAASNGFCSPKGAVFFAGHSLFLYLLIKIFYQKPIDKVGNYG